MIKREALRAVTLVEVIGVLALLVIITFLLLPRLSQTIVGAGNGGVSGSIHNAEIDEVLSNVQVIKTAVMQHQAKFGSLAPQGRSAVRISGSFDNYDKALLAEGLVDKPFAVRMGNSANVRLVKVSALSAASPVNAFNGAYDLSGSGHNEIVGASYLAEVVIGGVDLADADEFNKYVDGSAESGPDGTDLRGRVVSRPSSARSVELHVYITHY